MQSTYWSEPLPLKKAYPAETSGHETVVAMFAGYFLAFIAIIAVFPVTQNIFRFFWVSGILAIFAVSVFLVGRRIAVRLRRGAWRQAFLANNDDLMIQVVAVQQVVDHLRATTSYFDVTFEKVAIHLACSLRMADPFAPGEHTSFTWEVLHAYRHFAFGDKEIQPTRCPRQR